MDRMISKTLARNSIKSIHNIINARYLFNDDFLFFTTVNKCYE